MDFQQTLAKLQEHRDQRLKRLELVPGIEVTIRPASALDVVRIGAEEDQTRRMVLMLNMAQFDQPLTFEEAEQLLDLIPGSELLRVFQELSEALGLGEMMEIESKQDFLEPTPSLESSSVKQRNGANGRTSSVASRQIAPPTP